MNLLEMPSPSTFLMKMTTGGIVLKGAKRRGAAQPRRLRMPEAHALQKARLLSHGAARGDPAFFFF